MKSFILIGMFVVTACHQPNKSNDAESVDTTVNWQDEPVQVQSQTKANPLNYQGANQISTGSTSPEALILFAKTLMGIPYKYASSDPVDGFDCSGFITYVFNHFNIAVPRSSVDFTNVQREVPLSEAKPGDLILFTGTDSSIRVVGHMGIVTGSTQGLIKFIHSTSGKQYGVTITPLEKYYLGRFVKVVRVFMQNDG